MSCAEAGNIACHYQNGWDWLNEKWVKLVLRSEGTLNSINFVIKNKGNTFEK